MQSMILTLMLYFLLVTKQVFLKLHFLKPVLIQLNNYWTKPFTQPHNSCSFAGLVSSDSVTRQNAV